MRQWLPVSTSPKGRLALTAVREFGTRPYDEVTVGELASAADVTTGALYHHFQNKLGLYTFVRIDVERRLLDRMEGAAAAEGRVGNSALKAALAVGFDFAVHQGFIELLGEHPGGKADDPLVELLARLTHPAPSPLARLLAAAWRAAIYSVAEGAKPESVRTALTALDVDLRPHEPPHADGDHSRSPEAGPRRAQTTPPGQAAPIESEDRGPLA